MSDILVRGLPERVHRQIQRLAESQHSSVNQILVHLITIALKEREKENDADERRREAFRRIRELREEIYRKYGPQEDSTKIIREFRDNRNR